MSPEAFEAEIEAILDRTASELACDLVLVDKPLRAEALARALERSLARAVKTSAIPVGELNLMYAALAVEVVERTVALDELAEAPTAGHG